MDKVLIKHEEYRPYEIISDICALLNSNGGRILISEKKDNDNQSEGNETLKRLLNGGFVVLSHSFCCKHVNISEYVSILRRNYKNHVTTTIKVKPHRVEDGLIIFNRDVSVYFFRNGKKLKIIYGSKFNEPFINQIIRDQKWELPDSFELPLYDLFSYTPNFNFLLRKNNVSVRWLDELNYIDHYYKYMSVHSALRCLENNNICFNQPSNWDDQYEKRFYDARYIDNNGNDVIMPKFYACCFTHKQDNEAAWSIYSHSTTNTGARQNFETAKKETHRAVEFKLNFRKLYEQLSTHIKDSVLYIGLVKYMSPKIIDNIHNRKIGINDLFIPVKESDNPYYYHYFDPSSTDSYLNLMLLKRDAFEHEQEIRLFIVPKSQEQIETRKLVSINWIDVIEQVRIDKNCTDEEKSRLQSALQQLLENKKREIDLGIKKTLDEGEDIKNFLSKSFIHSDWDDHEPEDFMKEPHTIIMDYITKLEEIIKPISFDIYSSNTSNDSILTIIVNSKN